MAQLLHLLLGLVFHAADLHLELRDGVADVVDEHLVERLGQKLRAQPVGDGTVERIVLEEQRLRLLGRLDVLALGNVGLRAIHHSDEAQLEWIRLAQKRLHAVGALEQRKMRKKERKSERAQAVCGPCP